MWSICTWPKFAIGQRCVLLETDGGNVLWDCITYLDDETVDFIKGRGGLKAIVISHPHYYTTHLDWAAAFDCPVYFAVEDVEWVSQPDPANRRRHLKHVIEKILPGVVVAKPGGHFPGSVVLSWDKKLFIADTLVTVPVRYPSPLYPTRMQKLISYSPPTTTSTGQQARQATPSCGRSRI